MYQSLRFSPCLSTLQPGLSGDHPLRGSVDRGQGVTRGHMLLVGRALWWSMVHSSINLWACLYCFVTFSCLHHVYIVASSLILMLAQSNVGGSVDKVCNPDINADGRPTLDLAWGEIHCFVLIGISIIPCVCVCLCV